MPSTITSVTAPQAFYAKDGQSGVLLNGAFVADWFNSSWSNRKTIVIDSGKIGSDETDFPVLINLAADADISGTARSDGFDILFTDAAGTQLKHERETYVDGTGELVAWVKIPSLSSAFNTILYLYYGNAGSADQSDAVNVWDTDFAAVYHLGSGLDFLDSTSNNNDGTNSGTTNAAAQIGDGAEFDTSTDVIDCGSDASIDNIFDGGGTASAWINLDTFGGASFGRVFNKADTNAIANGWQINLNDVTFTETIGLAYEFSGGQQSWVAPASSMVVGQWHHVVFTYDADSDANDPIIYIDGASVSVTQAETDTGTRTSDAAESMLLGNSVAGDRGFDGTMDEMRISTSIRSASWVATEHANQDSPSTFYELGSEETEAAAPWADSNYGFRKSISLQVTEISAAQTDFPVMISVTDADVSAAARSDGFDIFFTDAGGTQLKHERERYVTGTGELIAWVKVPSLLGLQCTRLYMYYGFATATDQADPANVWDASFGAVWHLGDGLNFLDSTANNNDGTNAGSIDATGQIGDGQDFDGVDDEIDFGIGASLDTIFAGGGTASIWINPDTFGESDLGSMLSKTVDADNRWLLSLRDDVLFETFHFFIPFSGADGDWRAPSNTVVTGTWQHIAVTYDSDATANDPTFYYNGLPITETQLSTPTGTVGDDSGGTALMGNNAAGTVTFDGTMDEARLSTVARSASWIATEYNNQNSPSTFHLFGSEVTEASPDPTTVTLAKWWDDFTGTTQVALSVASATATTVTVTADRGAIAEGRGYFVVTSADLCVSDPFRFQVYDDTPDTVVVQVRATLNAGAGSQDITTSELNGLTPIAAYVFGAQIIADGTSAGASLHAGLAVSGANRGLASGGAEDGVGTTDTGRTTRNSEFIMITEASSPETIARQAEFTSMIADGIRINLPGAGTEYVVGIVMVAGTHCLADLTEFDLPNSGSIVSPSLGYDPNFAVVISSGTNVADAYTNQLIPSFGYAAWPGQGGPGATREQTCLGWSNSDLLTFVGLSAVVSDQFVATQILAGTIWTFGISIPEAQRDDGYSLDHISGSPGTDDVFVLSLFLAGVSTWTGPWDPPVA